VKDLNRGSAFFPVLHQSWPPRGSHRGLELANALADSVSVVSEGQGSPGPKIGSGDAQHRYQRVIPGTQTAAVVGKGR